MEFLIVPVDQLKEIDPDWEYRRKSNDGTKALIHKEIFDELVPPVMTLEMTVSEGEEPTEPQPRQYPFPVIEAEAIDSNPDFMYIPTEEERALMGE